jgi:SET domain-containing protein
MEKTIIIKSTKFKKTGKKGRGVFALKDFKKGELIERCPVITFSPKERKILEKTILNFYIYPWKSTRGACLAFGNGSIYNHSYTPNADWKQNFEKLAMDYVAIKDIKAGEEILINYNGEPDDTKEIDFSEWKDAAE